MGRWKILSSLEAWELVSRKIEAELSEKGFSQGFISSLMLATDEIFANISMYAYEECGDVIIESKYGLSDKERIAEISFCDFGKEFDPTKKNIDIKKDESTASRRKPGGLGIFLCKKQVDEMKYFYVNNSNNLVLVKQETV